MNVYGFMPSVIFKIMFMVVLSCYLFASEETPRSTPVHPFVVVSNVVEGEDWVDIQSLRQSVKGLNNSHDFEKSKTAIFKKAQAGERQTLEWLFSTKGDLSVASHTGENSYFRRLWPDHSMHDFFLKDLQAVGVNLEAFEYYLYDIRPQKSLMVEALQIALEKGWKNSDKYINVMWQIFNDIREDAESSRKEWVKTFKELQCLGYMNDIVTLDDLKIFPLDEMR